MQTTPPPATTPGTGTSGLAVASLVFAFLCFPVGLILAIVALSQINKRPGMGGKGLAIAGLIVSCAWLLCLPIQAAIAIPNFIRYQARAKQSECKANLKAAWAGQRFLWASDDAYTERVHELGVMPAAERYAYFFGADPEPVGPDANAMAPRVGETNFHQAYQAVVEAGIEPGIKGECPECEVVMACAANLDGDETYDVWSVSSQDRRGPRGEPIAAGEVFNHVSDVTD